MCSGGTCCPPPFHHHLLAFLQFLSTLFNRKIFVSVARSVVVVVTSSARVLTCDHQPVSILRCFDSLSIFFARILKHQRLLHYWFFFSFTFAHTHTHRSFKNCKFGLFIFALCFSQFSILFSRFCRSLTVLFSLLCSTRLPHCLRCRVPTLFSHFPSFSLICSLCLSVANITAAAAAEKVPAERRCRRCRLLRRCRRRQSPRSRRPK